MSNPNTELSALLFRIILFTGAAIGLVLNMADLGTWTALVYFTNQSNLLVMALTAHLIHGHLMSGKKKTRTSRLFTEVRGTLLVAISMTFIIFHFLLRPVLLETGYEHVVYSLQSHLLHYLVPLMFIFDWLLFDQKGRFRLESPFLWTIYPLLYFLFAVIRAQLGGPLPRSDSHYPYFFMDFNLFGHYVFIMIALILVGLCVYGYMLVFVDRSMDKTSLDRVKKTS